VSLGWGHPELHSYQIVDNGIVQEPVLLA